MAERRDPAADDVEEKSAPSQDDETQEDTPPQAEEVETDEIADDSAASKGKAKSARSQLREPKPGSRMSEQEQRWGKWLGLLSAVGFAVLAQPWLGGEHLGQAGLGVVMGMLLWAVARQGFRIRTAIASYMFLFAFGDLFIFGALHIGFAFLLAFRASREMGQARAEERMRQRKEGPAKPKPARGRKSKRKDDDADAEAASPPPVRVTEPNRRYTPPKPKKKRRR